MLLKTLGILRSILFSVGGLITAFFGLALITMSIGLLMSSDMNWAEKYSEFIREDSDYSFLLSGLIIGLILLGCFCVVEFFIRAKARGNQSED